MRTAVKKQIQEILAVMNITELVLEIRPEKNSGPYGISTHDLYDTGAALYQQLSQQANWKLVIMLDLLYSFLHHSVYIIFIYLQSLFITWKVYSDLI